jgi:hypothetical protein
MTAPPAARTQARHPGHPPPMCRKGQDRGRRRPGQAVVQREHPGLQPEAARPPIRRRRPPAHLSRRPGQRSCAPPSPSTSAWSPSAWCSATAPTRSSHLLNQVFLEPGDNIVMGEYGFGAYAIGARACQAEVRFAAEPGIASTSTPCWPGRRAHPPGVHRQARQPDRHLPDRRGDGRPARRPAADVVLVHRRRLCRVRRPIRASTTAWTWPARPRTSWSPAPSPSCTAWPPCASAGATAPPTSDATGPHPPAVQHLDPGPGSRRRRPGRRRLPGPPRVATVLTWRPG